MNKIRLFILFLGLNLIIISYAGAQTKDSVTKVGNGDNGADLEGLSPITSGPIIEARKQALKLLDKLNVVGVPGLGMLIPELEKTDLLMAAKDVYPSNEQKGSQEVSEDQNLVYARTFATPSAATRFFPAAKKLNSDQLVALHIHEALHRALPHSVRENEIIVMHFTLAITSPGASFDRVYQVSKNYLKLNGDPTDLNKAYAEEKPLVLPRPSNTYLGFQWDSYSYSKDILSSNYGPYSLFGLEYIKSIDGYRDFKGYAVEPVFRGRLKLFQGIEDKKTLGPASFDLEGRIALDSVIVGPFIRYTTKSIDDSSTYIGMDERDLMTLGGFYREESDHTYFNSNLGYSFSSTGTDNLKGENIEYKSILSLDTNFGYKINHLKIGALADLYSSKTRQNNSYYKISEPFRFIVAGLEFSYLTENFQFKMYYKKIINNSNQSMEDLGDIMDHGYGRNGYGTSFMFGW